MKKFFSLDCNVFNVFTFVGLFFLFLDIFYAEFPFIQLGLLISFIPQTVNGIKTYKETRKITFFIVAEIVLFLFLVYYITF